MLKACASKLCGVLQHLFNLSLHLQRVPVLWKASFLVPVPKKGHPLALDDYRLIVLTPHIMKVMERCRNFEDEYRILVSNFVKWYRECHLQLNKAKTKEMVVDFRRNKPLSSPVCIGGTDVAIVDSYKWEGLLLALS